MMLGSKARRTSPEKTRAIYRLANTVRLPWVVGLILLLLLALLAALFLGRSREDVRVPQAVLDAQELVTRGAADSVRRSTNEGIADLQAFSQTLAPVNGARTGELVEPMRGAADAHRRYLALYAVDDDLNLLESAGKGEPRPDLLDPSVTFREPGMTNAVEGEVGGAPVPIIQQFAPLPEETFPKEGGGEEVRRRAVVGHYDPYFFRFSLQVAEPGEVWLVDSDGRVIGSREAFTAFQDLPRRPLREAAARAVNGESGAVIQSGSLGLQEIVSFAPVTGDGPSGDFRWGVVTARSVESITLPQTDARRQGLLFAGLLALIVIIIFGWLYIILLYPLLKLQKEAERVAYGDLSRHVEVVRYDEVGLVARALERIRVSLIRRRVRESAGEDAEGGARNGSAFPHQEDDRA